MLGWDQVIAIGVFLFWAAILALILVAFFWGLHVFGRKLLARLTSIPYYYAALNLFSVSGTPRALGRWVKGYVRDEPGGRCRHCWHKACDEGILASGASVPLLRCYRFLFRGMRS